MNLAQLYSLSSGQKLGKIYTFEKFFPLPFNDKYIIFQPWSKPAKNYNNWQEVIEILYPFLQKDNIKIIQVGGLNEQPLFKCFYVSGQTNWGQLQYLISKCELVLTCDSVSAHLAGHYNKPVVDLICNNFKECVEPFYGDKKKQIILEPDRKNKNPSFMLDEGPIKQVDEIKPEIITESVCKLLGIEFNYPFKTLNMGVSYFNKMLESSCVDVINTAQIGVNNLIMRLDYNFNLAILTQQLQICKCSIVTDKPIPLNILNQFRTNVIDVVYKVTKAHNSQFVKELTDNRIPFRIFSELNDDELNKIKLDYIDLGIINKRITEKPEILNNVNLDKIYYKSGKLTVGPQGKIYQSKYDLKNDRNISSLISEPQKLIDKNIDLLWNESEYILYLERIDN